MPRQIGPLRSRIEYTGIAAVVAGLRAMPLERAVRAGARLGGWAMNLDRPNRSIALKNLAIAFPEKSAAERLAILRAMYRNWGRMLAEWAHFNELSRANIENVVTYQGKEAWEEAERRSPGRGILVLTAHFGNFELLPLAHSIYGYRIAIVYRPLRNPLIDAAVHSARIRYGNKIVPRKASGREMFRLLRQNWMLAITLDLDVRKGVFVDFFGLPASTSGGMARLAMATGAPVAPCVLVREGDTIHHRIVIEPLIEVVKDGNREESVRENTQRFTRTLENLIRTHPDHWNWIHRRWKTRPPGEARFY
ncbi:MAG: lysophospholipid acyltransferase family protein [Candidatus Binataceae bacterium]